jgi:hypothetical protein
MDERMASPAKGDLKVRIGDVSAVMHHNGAWLLADPAESGVPANDGLPVSPKVSLRMIPGVVVAQAQSDLGGRLAAITIPVLEQQRLGSHYRDIS